MSIGKQVGRRLSKKLLAKLIGFIGLPALAVIFLLIITAAATNQTFEQSAALLGSQPGRVTASGELSPQMPEGKATYVGVDDTDTLFSQKILAQTSKWSNSYPPFYSGYGGMCELWVYDTYIAAGQPCDGSCCAYHHGELNAHKTGAIPKGALIFSGIIPSTGQMYENNHRASAYCDVCGHYAGHVAIYVGNGMVAGSQIPYLQSVDAWIAVYGYGGWSTR